MEKTGMEIVRELLEREPLLYVSCIGLKKKARLYPLDNAFEHNGAIYFPVKKSEMRYGDLSVAKEVQLGVMDKTEGAFYLMSGIPVFTEDPSVLSTLKETEDPKMWIAFTLDRAILSVQTGAKETSYPLLRSDEVLYGIEMKKDPEIRDRIAKRIEERAQAEVNKDETQKLLDGALLYFAEKAKEKWPRMNLMPLEAVLFYETYDEREAYVEKAAAKIGNVTVDKVEDLTYYLSTDYLTGE